MPNREATLTDRLTGDTSPLSLPTLTVAVPYNAIQGGDLDVPDAASADTSYDVPFGTCAEATHVEIRNATGQAVAARIGGASVTGTLSSGTVTLTLAAVTDESLSVEVVTSGGTPGVLSVKRSGSNVIVQSWLLGTGLQTLDTSVVRVKNNAPPILADGGVLLVSNPSAGSVVSSAKVTLTALQSGAGKITTAVLGDPI